MAQTKEDHQRFLARLDKKSKHELAELLHQLYARKKIVLADVVRDQGTHIPCNIFSSDLSTFESICTYLKDHQGMNYHKIAVLLGRDDRTIWTVYHHALHKKKQTFSGKKSELTIPLNIFKDRSLSILEHIARYLKEDHGMTYHEIAVLLNRDDRTIWTVYNRARKKLGR
jgi:predicted DNA-binding protein (UPF0251 family)